LSTDDDDLGVKLLEIALPPGCVGCGARGALFCVACRSVVRSPYDARDRFVVPDAGVVVGEALSVAVAACAYEASVRKALAAVKYSGVRRLVPILAHMTAPALMRISRLAPTGALVPVPIHAERRAVRGYNQAELLAYEIARGSSHEVTAALERSAATAKQHRLNRSARLANLSGAFTARGVVPAVAILVDDIITTSATLEACAAALRAAGCEEVYGVVVAREI
jgi:ComF family protein